MKTKKNRNWYKIKAEGHTAEILIYDFIGEDFFGEGVSAKGLLDELKALKDVTEINVRINSPGGDVFDGIAIHNALERHPATINVHIDGLAASIASIIAMAGDQIIMAKNALMMIHNPHGFAIGDATEMRRTADLLDKAKESLVNTYADRVGDALSRDEIETLMDEVTWFTAGEAVTAGLADTIGNEVKIAAYFDLRKLNYAHIPETVLLVDEIIEPSASPLARGMCMSLATAKAKLKICETVSNEAPHQPA